MANYTSNLKTWGSTGQEHPDNYNYLEGEQPVDAWDNFINHNIITDLDHLVQLTNTRLESGQGTSHPASPESGELSLRTDSPEGGSGDQLFQYDDSSSTWHRLMKASGDTMSGDLDVGSNIVTDVSSLFFSGEPRINQAALSKEWFSKQEGGTVSGGSLVPIGTFELTDNETLTVTQSMLLEDGFTSPAPSGLDLIIADENASTEGDTTKILEGDGSTEYPNNETEVTYTNTSGGTLTVVIALDNGHYNSGSGGATSAYGGYIAKIT